MAGRRLLVAVAICAVLLVGQPRQTSHGVTSKGTAGKGAAAKATTRSAISTERQVALRWLGTMPLRERVGQLVILPFYGDNPGTQTRAYRNFAQAVREQHIGGFVILNRVQQGLVRTADPYRMVAFLNRMQRLSRIPLIVAGDFERGSSMRITGTPLFPHAMAFAAAGDLELTRQFGAATAREARAMGVQWLFAPDADVNNNPDNPIISTRSFGENAVEVAKHVDAFIDGARSDKAHRVLVTVKHFPGHGDTSVDSHMGLSQITADRDRLNQLELVPFRAAIEKKVDAVMTGHLAVPALEPEEIPATVSAKVLTKLLREELNFQGMIVTDALDMQGVTKLMPAGEAAVRALEAGVDILLMPQNARAAINAVVAAVESGRISRSRIEESVLKVLEAKAKTGLHVKKLVDPEAMSDELESPESEALAQKAADKAVTLVKNEGNLVPLSEPEKACWILLTETRGSIQGRKVQAEVRQRTPKAKVTLLDGQASEEELKRVSGEASDCATVVVPAFVNVSEYRGNTALAGNFPEFLENLIKSGKPLVLGALGNPYLLRKFPDVKAYLATFSTTPTSEGSLVRALYGEIPIQGHLPVTIPGIAKYGDGLQLAGRP